MKEDMTWDPPPEMEAALRDLAGIMIRNPNPGRSIVIGDLCEPTEQIQLGTRKEPEQA